MRLLFLIILIQINCSRERDRSIQTLLGSMLMIETPRYNSTTQVSVPIPERENPRPENIPPSLLGNNIVTANLNIASINGVDRYKDLEIIFSHSMNKATVESSFRLTDSSFFQFNSSNGTFTWFSEKRVFYTPYGELKQRENYTLRIGSSAQSTGGFNLSSYVTNFETEPLYNFAIALNGIQYSQNILTNQYMNTNGFIFDSIMSPTMTLNFSVNNSDLITSLKLFKMNDFGNSVPDSFQTLCSPCTGPTYTSSLVLTPREGANTYYFEVIDSKNKVFHNNFSFHWGRLQKNSLGQPSSMEWVSESVSFVLDKKNVMHVIERVIKEWGRGVFTLVGKTLNEFLNEGKINTPSPGCLPFSKWDPTNQPSPATIFNQVDSSFQYIPRIGPFCAIDVNGFALYGTSVQFLGNTYIAPPMSNSYIDIGSLSVPNIFVNMYISEVIDTGLIPNQTKILTITNLGGNVYRYTLDKKVSRNQANVNLKFNYGVVYQALADGYVSSVTVPQVDQTNADFNLVPYITPREGYIDVTLGAKKATGRASIIAQVVSIEPHLLSIAPIGSRFSFHDNLSAYSDGPSVGFQLNPTNNTERFLTATILPSVNASNKVLIGIHNENSFNSYVCVRANDYCARLSNQIFLPNISPLTTINPVLSINTIEPILDTDSLWNGATPRITKMNPLATNWAENITVNNIISTGAIGAILADIANKILPDFKFKIIQNASKDILTRLVPELIDTILKQLKGWESGDPLPIGWVTGDPLPNGKGMLIKFPDTGADKYPYPFRKLTLDVRARPTFVESKSFSNAKVIQGRVDTKILVEETVNADPAISSFPPVTLPANQRSFLLMKNPMQAIQLQGDRSHETNLTGLLLAVHSDALNQALYHLWNKGAFNILLDDVFLTELNSFLGGNTSLTSYMDVVLKGSNFRQIMAPGKVSHTKWKDNSKTATVTIENDDKISFQIIPYLPPVVKAHIGPDPALMQDPQLEFQMHDAVILIQGKKLNNSVYSIAKVKASINSRIRFGISLFSKVDYPTVGSYRRALNLKVSSEQVDLRYKIEFGKGVNENPLGLDPEYVHALINPLVPDLILPLLNDILKEIPLPVLEGCGINIFNLNQQSIPSNTVNPFLLLNAQLFKTAFTGDCTIQ